MLPLASRVYVAAEVAAQTHFFSVEDQDGNKSPTARFALRSLLAIGAWL